MNRGLISGCLVLLLFFSCGRKFTPFESGSSERSKPDIRNVDFEYFSSKSKMMYKDEKKDQNATANIRIKKDSIIWFSVSAALGIEAIRGVITKDSITIIDRLNKTYASWDYERLSEEILLPIDYFTIQSLILGNIPVDNIEDFQVSRKEGFFLLKENKGSVDIENYVSSKTMKLERLLVSEHSSRNNLTVTYGNFQIISDRILPLKTEIILNYNYNGEKLTLVIGLEHNKIELTDKQIKFPFNIPEKYDRK